MAGAPSNPRDVVAHWNRYEKLQRECTSLRKEQLRAQYLSEIPRVEWTVRVTDVAGDGINFRVSGRVRQRDFLLMPVEWTITAVLAGEQHKERLLSIKLGQEVTVSGIPYFVPGIGEYGHFNIMSADVRA